MKILCIIALTILLLFAASPKPNQNKPSIALLTAAGAANLKKQSQGKVLVINFWATWCHGCVGEFPEFVALDKEYRSKGVKIVGISLDQRSDIDSKVTPFIKKSDAQFDIAVPDMDDPKPVIDQLTPEWTGAMPVTLIFDRSGALVYKRFGVIDREEVVGVIKHLLAG